MGESRGVSPEVPNHLHSFERVELQVVGYSQLLNLLSVSRLVSVLDEANDGSVVRKLQELDRGVLWSAVIGVEREEQWGENAALRGASADGESSGCEFINDINAILCFSKASLAKTRAKMLKLVSLC